MKRSVLFGLFLTSIASSLGNSPEGDANEAMFLGEIVHSKYGGTLEPARLRGIIDSYSNGAQESVEKSGLRTGATDPVMVENFLYGVGEHHFIAAAIRLLVLREDPLKSNSLEVIRKCGRVAKRSAVRLACGLALQAEGIDLLETSVADARLSHDARLLAAGALCELGTGEGPEVAGAVAAALVCVEKDRVSRLSLETFFRRIAGLKTEPRLKAMIRDALRARGAEPALMDRYLPKA